MGDLDHFVKIVFRTVKRVDFRVVLHVITTVCLGAFEKWAEPDRPYAKTF